MKIKLIISLLTFAFFSSCTEVQLSEINILGTWSATDGGTIQFLDNGQCKIKDLKISKIYTFNDSNVKNLTTDAKWVITKSENKIKIDISYQRGGGYEYNGKFFPYLSGFQLQLDNYDSKRNKFKLFIPIGDPDEFNRYEFIKK